MEQIELKISVCPENPAADVNAAAMALIQKDLVSAKRFLDRSDDHNAQFYNNLGVYHFMNQEFTMARRYFQNATAMGLLEAESNLIEMNCKAEYVYKDKK